MSTSPMPSGTSGVSRECGDLPEGVQPRVGAYRLLGVLGEGGMGTVYLAEQEQPVQRRVAVKVLKGEVVGRRVLARFEQERQALARLNHPNVATVLDAGFTDDGRPFVVMEWIDGQPIHQYCEERKLERRERLQLFVRVCRAVQHAHQKGVIHRDIKPSNVLVVEVDGTPVPRVIDFGIARVEGLGESSGAERSYVVGTPEYMAPEQANAENPDVDTRADVYALGMLLHELLTGTLPAAVARPSETEVIAGRKQKGATVEEACGQQVIGDLKWVVERCLRTDREERYQSASELAEEVERYLGDLPVEAAPPSQLYRARRFLRRHRMIVTAVGLVIVALMVGVVGTALALVQARAAERKANEEAEARAEALTALEVEQKRTAAALAEAKRASRQTMAVLRHMSDEVIEKQMTSRPRLSDTDRAVLARVLKQFEEFSAVDGESADIRSFRVEGLSRVGWIRMRLGDMVGAAESFEKSIALLKELIAEQPEDLIHRGYLSRILVNLGTALYQQGRNAEAEKIYREAMEEMRRLEEADPAASEGVARMGQVWISLGNIAYDRGQFSQAEKEYRTGLAQFRGIDPRSATTAFHRQSLAGVLGSLGRVLQRQGKLVEAESVLRESQELYQKLADAAPEVPMYREELAISLGNLGSVRSALRKTPENEYRRAMELGQQLVREYPAVPIYRQQLALNHNNMALWLLSLGKFDEADGEFTQATQLQQRLADEHPEVPRYRVDLGGSYCNYAHTLTTRGRAAEAVGWYDRAISTLERVVRVDPQAEQARQYLRNSYMGRVLMRMERAQYAEALEDLARVQRLDAGEEQIMWKHCRLFCLARTDPSRAVDEAEAYLKKSANSGTRVVAAGVYAVVSTQEKDATVARAKADRAMALLQDAARAGAFRARGSLSFLQRDRAFDSLRDRADFRKLLAEWEKQSQKPAKARVSR